MATLHPPHFEREERPRLVAWMHLFWAGSATIVLVFIVLAALGVIDPTEGLGG